jgi:hypothetical protein
MKAGLTGAACEYVPFLFRFGKSSTLLIKKDNPILFFFCFGDFTTDVSPCPRKGRDGTPRARFGFPAARTGHPA